MTMAGVGTCWLAIRCSGNANGLRDIVFGIVFDGHGVCVVWCGEAAV